MFEPTTWKHQENHKVEKVITLISHKAEGSIRERGSRIRGKIVLNNCLVCQPIAVLILKIRMAFKCSIALHHIC